MNTQNTTPANLNEYWKESQDNLNHETRHLPWSRKVNRFSRANTTEMSTWMDLTDDLAALRRLEIADDWTDDVEFIEGEQFAIVIHDGEAYLVDNQGFSYARYVTHLDKYAQCLEEIAEDEAASAEDQEPAAPAEPQPTEYARIRMTNGDIINTESLTLSQIKVEINRGAQFIEACDFHSGALALINLSQVVRIEACLRGV